MLRVLLLCSRKREVFADHVSLIVRVPRHFLDDVDFRRQNRHFGLEFLNLVFSEAKLPGFKNRADVFGISEATTRLYIEN